MAAPPVSSSVGRTLGRRRAAFIAGIRQLRSRAAWSELTMSGRSDQVVLECERRGSRARGDLELPEDVLQVAGDGVLAEDERRRDLAVAPTGRDESQHLQLALREPVDLARPTRLGEGSDPRGVRCRAEPFECLRGGLQLEAGRVVIAECPAREPDQYTCPCRLV